MKVTKVSFDCGASVATSEAFIDQEVIIITGRDGGFATLASDDVSALFPRIRGWMENGDLVPVEE